MPCSLVNCRVLFLSKKRPSRKGEPKLPTTQPILESRSLSRLVFLNSILNKISLALYRNITKKVTVMPLPLGLILAPQLLKTAIGGLQTFMGKERGDKLERPVRGTSTAVEEGVARSRFMAQGEDPQVQFIRDQALTTQAGTVSQIQKAGGTSSTTMAAALGAQKQANRTNLQAGQMGQQFKLSANVQYLQQLQGLAKEHQMNFEWNQAQKFQEEADAARSLTEAGLQNMMTGVTEIAGGSFAHTALKDDPSQSPFWNQKQGYMGTVEQYEAKQAAAMAKYKAQIAPKQPGAVSNPMHGKFGEGMNTEGYMNPWMPELSKLLAMPQQPY